MCEKPQEPDKGPVVTLEEAAPLMFCSVSLVRKLVQSGKLAHFRHSKRGRIYIYTRDIETYLASIRREAA